MKGLLLKDLYLGLKHFTAYILLILLFAVLSVADTGNVFFTFYPCIICGMLPVNLMAFDEQSKWDKYTAVLPFTRSQVVASKYIVGLIGQGTILLLVAIANVVKMMISGGMDWDYFLSIMGIMVMLSAITTSVPLPFIFRLGVEKGRMGYYIMIGLAAGGSGAAAGILGNSPVPMVLPIFAFPVMVLTGIAVYVFSWWLSVDFYKHKDL